MRRGRREQRGTHLGADRASLPCALARALQRSSDADARAGRTSLYVFVVGQVAGLISAACESCEKEMRERANLQTMEGKRGGLICAALLAAIAYICSLVYR